MVAGVGAFLRLFHTFQFNYSQWNVFALSSTDQRTANVKLRKRAAMGIINDYSILIRTLTAQHAIIKRRIRSSRV